MSALAALAGNNPSPVDLSWVAEALQLSVAAGPDDQAHQAFDRCVLGHALLQTGHDVLGPTTLDGRAWITADARLDAREALCESLRTADRDLSPSAPDAELLLAAYRRWGERMVEHIAGDFAFVIWDAEQRRLIGARDQIGIVPLHYAQSRDSLLVSTSVEAPLAHPAVSEELDESATADFLAFGFHTDPSATAFAAVRQLPPAHLLTWADGELRVRRYWTLPEWEPLARFPSLQDGADQLRELLDTAVADRLTTSRASVLLSGGMDSTSVMASAIHVLRCRGVAPEALRAYTSVLGGSSGDREGEYACLVAEEFGAPIDVDNAATRPTIDPFAPPLVRSPEPTPYQFSDYLLRWASVPASYARVAFSGHGSDVLFGFVPWYFLDWLVHGRVARVARALTEQVHLSGGRPRPHLRTILRFAGYGRTLRPRQPPWLLGELVERTGLIDRQLDRMPKPFGIPARHMDARALRFDPMWAELFRMGDPTFTKQPLRVRHPFTDLRLLRFARTLPPEPWLVGKQVLRDAGRSRLPDAIYNRPKTLLVNTPASGADTAALTSLAHMVGHTPELRRFVDTDLLARDVASGADDADVFRRWWRERALGLAYWLWHRQGR